jgi:hypothetical protein
MANLVESPTEWGGMAAVRRALFVLLVLGTTALLLAGAGTLVGRFRLWAVAQVAPDARIARSALVVLVPVPVQKLAVGDRIVVRRHGERSATLYEVDAVPSKVDPVIEVLAPDRTPVAVRISGSAWRVSRTVPAIGGVLHHLPGSILGWLLIGSGAGLFLADRVRRLGAAAAPVPLPQS